MGMYDNIRCDYPLPIGPNGPPPDFVMEPGYLFQSKDLDCSLSVFTIKADGTFDYETAYTGELEFYTSNICGSGPGLYTRTGEDAISVDYLAKFVDGKLTSIVETAREIRPALPSKAMSFKAPTPE